MSRSKSRICQWTQRVLCVVLALVLWLMPTPAYSTTAQTQLDQIDTWIESSLTQLESGNGQAARQSYQRFARQWEGIEDQIRAASPQAYYQIEKTMAQVMVLLAQPSTSQADLAGALRQLHQVNQDFITATPSPSASTPPPGPPDSDTLTALLLHLDQARSEVAAGEWQQVSQVMAQVQQEWVEIEGRIASKSSTDYDRIETLTAEILAASQSSTPNPNRLQAQLQTLQATLRSYQEESQSYGIWDATVILLREGLEALLVIVALLAFLNKSGNGDKQGWIWLGAGAGVLASVATAVGIRLFFSALFTAANQELIEGITGLTAAVVLIYVSYWLHRRSAGSQWQGYLQQQVATAVQRNGLFSLAVLAFLAIYREGAETVLFYVGIAPSIAISDLILGLALGILLLGALATLMFGLGVRLPLRPFFLISSLLIYFLGFKFLGNGFHALQVAGIFPSHTIESLPAIGGLGLYPTWETLSIQLSLLLVAAGILLFNRYSQASAPGSN